MQKKFSIPFFFLFVAACIGLLLRWHFIIPISWLKYPYWLHAHSHIMFLGWVFNVLFLAFVWSYNLSLRYHKLFILMQILLAGMLVSFPLQGYGVISIILSTLHTFSGWVFSFWLFKDFRQNDNAMSKWFAKSSLIFFIVSSLGPFALGPLMASGLAQSKWYYFAVYYYLHFQYNGVFILGLLSLLFQLLEEKSIPLIFLQAKKSGILLFISLFPTYFLSTLWADPGIVFNLIGLAGAILQLIALYYFLRTIRGIGISVSRPVKLLMKISLIGFVIKTFLQLISAHPVIAQLASDVRSFTIAYLHLVLIGVITFFLLAWYLEKGIIKVKSSTDIVLLIIGFIGSELVMIESGMPRWLNPSVNAILLFFFSVLIVLGIGLLAYKLILSRHDPSESC